MSEAESELVAGYNTEYSGMRWAIFFLAEYANLISPSPPWPPPSSSGGWSGPGFLPPFVWFLIKVYFFIFLVMWIRWTLPAGPRRPADEPGLEGLIPLSLVNLAFTGIYVLLR